MPAGKEYQLWIIDPADESPVSAGVFNTDTGGDTSYAFRSTSPIEAINAFALTIENVGGSERPQGPIVMVSG